MLIGEEYDRPQNEEAPPEKIPKRIDALKNRNREAFQEALGMPTFLNAVVMK